MSWLWEQLHDLFDQDDGSLPEVSVEFTHGEHVAQGYSIVSARGSIYNPSSAFFWSNESTSEVPVTSVPNPATLVVSGEAEPFHLCFQHIRSSAGATVPDLGLYVFQRELAFDYRMGAEWGPPQLTGLLELLADLAALAPDSRVFLQDGTPAEDEARFQVSWARFLEERAAFYEDDPVKPSSSVEAGGD